MRKRKDIKYNDSFDEVDENSTPDSIEHDKATESRPVFKYVSTESKKEHNTQPRKKWREQKNDV